MGLMGGLAGALQHTFGPWLPPAALLALAILLANDRRVSRKDNIATPNEDMTTLVAALVTMLLGLLATTGAIDFAVACAVIVVMLVAASLGVGLWQVYP